MMHTMDGMADKFIKDITDTVVELMKNPEKPVEGKVLKSYKQWLRFIFDQSSVHQFFSLDGAIWTGTNFI